MAKQKTSWQEKFEVVGIVPGEIFHPSIGNVNLADADLSIEVINTLIKEECPFIQLKAV